MNFAMLIQCMYVLRMFTFLINNLMWLYEPGDNLKIIDFWREEKENIIFVVATETENIFELF